VSEQPSTTGYLVRAIYDWCCDTSQTPYVSVRVSPEAVVPIDYVKDGEITLNISPDATRDLKIDNDSIHFSARFNSVSMEVYVPITDVKGIFSRESGQGLGFQVAPLEDRPSEHESVTTTSEKMSADSDKGAKARNAHLKLVK
jgi:stringent starvation protein B